MTIVMIMSIGALRRRKRDAICKISSKFCGGMESGNRAGPKPAMLGASGRIDGDHAFPYTGRGPRSPNGVQLFCKGEDT